jgi:hypothetical protein
VAAGRLKLSPLGARKYTTVLLGIALAGLAVRTVPVLTRSDLGWAMEPNGDSRVYISLADGLKRGCGFSSWAGDHCIGAPETNRTPGYSFFLSIMPTLRIALIAQALLSSLLCFLVGLFAAKFASARAGYCAAGIIAVDVPSIVSSNEIMSETLFTALLVGAVLAELEMLRNAESPVKLYYLSALASAVLGMALLVKPIAEFLIPLAILAPMLSPEVSPQKKACLALLVATGPIVCVTAWTLRNHSVAGVTTLSTIAGLNFFYYRAIGTLAFASGTGWTETLGRERPLPNTDLSVQACGIILHHPFAFAAMTLWSFVYLCWVPDRAPLARLLGIPSVLGIQDPGSVRIETLVHNMWAGHFTGLNAIFTHELHSSLVLLLLVVLQLMMVGLTWAGVMLALRKNARHRSDTCVLFAFAMSVLILLLASGPEAVARFRIPATPLLALVAAVGWFGATPAERE